MTFKGPVIDPDNPISAAVCDATGFVTSRSDLVKQYQYRGNQLVWTGFLVDKHFVDVPNPQLMNPVLPPDPVPVKQPRVDNQMNQIGWALQDTPWMWVTEQWDEWGYQG